MKKKIWNLLKTGLGSFIILGLFSVPVFSATITVTNASNSGAGSLRQAIIDAGSGDTILFGFTFPATITLASTITINKNLTIKGPGSGNLTISGNSTFRIFDVTAGTITIAKLSIANGGVVSAGADGAAFRVTGSSNLTIDQCDVHNNQLSGGTNEGGAFWCEAGTTLNIYRSHLYSNSIPTSASCEGGAIYSQGDVTMISSTISGCTSRVGPAIQFRGASGKNFNLVNCTISGNTSTLDGAIVHQHTGTMNFTNCTVTNNTAGQYEAGLFVDDGHVTFRNTVIAGNIASDGGDYIDMDIDTGGLYNGIAATMQSYGYNLIGVESAPFFTWTTGDVRGTKASPQSANLGALADNGGYKHTHDPNAGSQVINPASSNSAPFVDGKGYLRSGNADKGSCEDGGSLPVATSASSVGETTFNANWNSVTGATGYLLDVAEDSGFTQIVSGYHDLAVGNVTTYVISGLTASTTYYYRVRATAGNYHSYYTNTITQATVAGATATSTPTISTTATPTFTLTVTPTHTPTTSPTHTSTFSPTDTPTASPTHTPTVTPTDTPVDTATITPSVTTTHTPTGTYTHTPTFSPTVTASASVTFTPTFSPTATESATATVTPSATLTATESATATVTATVTLTATESATATATPTVTLTATESATSTITPSVTLTATESPTCTYTATITQTSTVSPTSTITVTTVPIVIEKDIVAFPNPAKNKMRFAVKLEQAEEVTINIYNLSGEKIAVVKGTMSAGTSVLEWACNDVAPGIYIARVKTNKKDKKIKIVITK